jgi:hypothetical protein
MSPHLLAKIQFRSGALILIICGSGKLLVIGAIWLIQTIGNTANPAAGITAHEFGGYIQKSIDSAAVFALSLSVFEIFLGLALFLLSTLLAALVTWRLKPDVLQERIPPESP